MPTAATAAESSAWKPLIVCPHPRLSEGLRTALGELGAADYVQLLEYPGIEAAAGIAARHGCNVFFLDVFSNPETAMAALTEAASSGPVIALCPSDDSNLILRCLRRGASEFVFEPVTAAQVKSALDRIGRLHPAAEPKKTGTVVCVIPGKPGCGGSTVAAHLAAEMKRSGAGRVLLADFDTYTGTIGFLLKIKNDFHLCHAVRDWKRMDGELWNRLLTPCAAIDVLPAPDRAVWLEIDGTLAAQMVSFFREHYDAVVLDTAGVCSPATPALAALSDHVLVVTTAELAVLHATGRTLDCLEAGGVARAGVKLLLNRNAPAAGLRQEDIATALKVEVYAALANDYEALQAAILDGRTAPPSSRFVHSIASLAGKLAGRGPAARTKPSLRTLLSRK